MAFVEMGSITEAKKAIEGLDQQVIDGRTVKANFAIPQLNVVKKEEVERDLEYKSKQLDKKARNDAKRKVDKFDFKGAKKVTKKTSKK